MKILITAAASRLTQALANHLSATNEVRLTDRSDVSTPHEFIRADLGHGESTNGLVRGMDAIIHVGESDPALNASEKLDAAMRGTYNLLWAAREEGVERIVYLSSLDVMGKYDEDLAVTERWLPVPTTDPDVLCFHMGEYVCREFAREQKTNVVCLRLGNIAWDADGSSTSTLYPDDAFQAVERALIVEVTFNWTSIPSTWNVFHVQSSVPNQRFLTGTARETLGFQPANRG
ncbi:MAG: NAD(P)-dependent oxidoreductase [bacterium]|nr:NAD(P)-dependent oxidoreductase [bacterium]